MTSWLWLAAFISALMPLHAYEAHSFAVAFILLSVVFLVQLSRPRVVVPTGLPVVCLLMFWTLALLSVFLSAVPYTSFIYFCFFSMLPLSFFLATGAAEPRRFFMHAGYGLAAVFLLLGLSSIAQYFFFPGMLFKGYVHWPLANPNSLAGLYMMGLIAAFGWMLAAPNRGQSNMALGLAVVLSAALLMTGSRGALAALAGGIILLVFLCPAFVKKHRRCCGVLLAASAAAFVLPGLLDISGAKTPMHAVTSSFSGRVPVLSDRPAIWASTWQIIREHFWTGTGIGTFFLYYPEVRADDVRTAGLMAHSDPLQFWAEMGVLAPVLFYMFIVAVTARTFRALKSCAPDDPRRVIIAASFCALGAMALHTHITFHLNVLSILMLSGFVLAVWHHVLPEGPETAVFESDAVKAAMIMPILAAVIIFSGLQGSEILVDRAKKKLAQGDLSGFAGDVNLAGRISFDRNARALVMGASVPLGMLENSNYLQPEAEQYTVRRGLKLLDRAEQLNPRLASIPYFRARYVKVDIREAAYPYTAEDLLRRALALDPEHLAARQMLAEHYRLSARPGEALAVLRDGLKWEYDLHDPVLYYRQTVGLAMEQGDKETRKTAMRKLSAYMRRQGRK